MKRTLTLELQEIDVISGDFNPDGQLRKFIRQEGKKNVRVISCTPFEKEIFATISLKEAKEVAESILDNGEFDVIRGNVEKFFS
ncbi:MAG: hypothetical protein WCY82_11145 [Desulfotomaculaceae bacterium]